MNVPPGYVYVIRCPEAEEEIAAAEAWAFTGAEPQGRLSYAPVAVDVGRAAYVSHCVHIEAAGRSLDELVAVCREQGTKYEEFRIECLPTPPSAVDEKEEAVRRLADAIEGSPNLSRPRIRLGIVASPQAWHFGRIVSESAHSWLRGRAQPFHISSALPHRLARALVNLVAAPGDTLIDPCCGAGTVLLEALTSGVVAFGADLNRKILRGLAQNLRALGLPLRLFRADARQLGGSFDAGLLDLPYGRNMRHAATDYQELLAAVGACVRRLAVVAGEDITPLFASLGFTILRYARVPKNQLVRHIYVLRTKS